MTFLTASQTDLSASTYEKTGFVDPDNVGVAYDATNRTITLTHSSGSVFYYYLGQKYRLASGWVSTAHTNTTGTYYWLTLGVNGAETWTAGSTPVMNSGVFVAYVQFGAVHKFGIRENHGLMDWETWRNLHDNVGTYRRSGGLVTAGSFALNTNTVAAVTPAIDSMVVMDEDLGSTVAALTDGSTYTRLHFDTNAAVFTTGSTFPFPDDGSDIQYNQNPVTGTALTSMTTPGRYVNVYVLFVPVTSDATSQAYRHICLTGQQIYTTSAAAQAEDFRTLQLGNLSGIFTEFVPYVRLTYERVATSNLTRNAQFTVNPSYLSGSRAGFVSVSGFSPTDHGTLTGRTTVDSHPATAVSTTTTGFNRILSGSDTNVQLALDTIDNMDTASNRLVVTQISHGFAAGDVLYYNGSAYAKAKADAAATAEVVGVVQSSIDADNFWLFTDGRITGLSGLTAGSVYYLSAGTAGLLTATEPSVLVQISKPVLIADSTTSGYIVNMRGVVVGGTNARTVISLANNATTTIQDVSAYDAGELSGWIYIDATADTRMYFAAQFAKLGSGTDYGMSYQTSGDVLAGVSISVTAAGLVQVTLPSVTGFSSASANFSLNAPAVGATFPLSISTSQVLGRTDGSTPGVEYIGQVITWSSAPSSQSITSTSYVDWTNATFTLTPGVWQIFANVTLDYNTGTNLSDRGRASVAITDNAGTIIQSQERSASFAKCSVAGVANAALGMAYMSCVEVVSSNKPYKLMVKRTDSAGTGTSTVFNQSSYYSDFYAVRIA